MSTSDSLTASVSESTGPGFGEGFARRSRNTCRAPAPHSGHHDVRGGRRWRDGRSVDFGGVR